jgi:hypothetical protein
MKGEAVFYGPKINTKIVDALEEDGNVPVEEFAPTIVKINKL